MKQALSALFVLAALTLLAACGTEEVIHGLSEREANNVIELLAKNDPSIDGMKLKEEGRIVTYKIVVPAKFKHDAYKLLNKHELPRKTHPDYMGVFSQSGLIPTKSEERAKSLAALQGEIAKQIQLLPNVLEAEVNVVIPDANPLATPGEEKPRPSAAVAMKYLPDAQGQPPISKDEIQQLVSRSVEDLKPTDVFVKLAQSNRSAKAAAVPGAAAEVKGSFCKAGKTPIKLFGRRMCPEASVMFKVMMVVFVIIIFLLSGGLIMVALRGKTVKTRLLRLQAELANRRRKGGTQAGAVPAPSASGVDPEAE